MSGHWIVVASADHVARGVAGGFVQACHGKRAPLARMKPGDQVFCYSPVAAFGGEERVQAFTAVGTIAAGSPYEARMAGGFRPHRRDVAWTRTGRVPIRPLLDKLELTAGKRSWGMPFRPGLVAITARDAALIGVALGLASARACAARTSRGIGNKRGRPAWMNAA